MKLRALILVLALCGVALRAQAPTAEAPAQPTLTEAQKLQVVNAAKDVEIWALRAQVVAGELEKAQKALAALRVAVAPKGYRLTDQLQLEKVPDPPAAK